MNSQSFFKKRYTIPKYLLKRKLQLLRERIITRKYGYIFYRKTVSILLPSEARKHYLRNLLRRTFNEWFSHYYEATIGWKHSLRAEIHYNLKIEHKYLEAWRHYWNNRKRLAVQKKLAAIYYDKNKKRFETRLCLQKWKLFIAHRHVEKGRLSFAWGHFKAKHFPEILRPYFCRWMVLIKAARKKKEQYNLAIRAYKLKLLKNCFRKLVQYNTHRANKKHAIKRIQNYYERKLAFQCFYQWKWYLHETMQYKTNMALAQANELFKLKKHVLKCLHKQVIRGKFLVQAFKAINLLIKKKSFAKWMIFVKQKHASQHKYEMLIKIHQNKLKHKVLLVLINYGNYRKQKRATFEEQIVELKTHLKKSKLKFYFRKWGLYLEFKKTQNIKLIRACTYSDKNLLQKSLSCWRGFKEHKKTRKSLQFQALNHYNAHLKQTYFQNILQHLIRVKTLKNQIERAKKFHRNNLAEEAIRIIALAGIHKKDQLLKENIEKINRELFIAQKYLSIWKHKTIYKQAHKYATQEAFCESSQTFSATTEWFQMCFLLPRVFNNNSSFS